MLCDLKLLISLNCELQVPGWQLHEGEGDNCALHLRHSYKTKNFLKVISISKHYIYTAPYLAGRFCLLDRSPDGLSRYTA